jgi:hypothetical protein
VSKKWAREEKIVERLERDNRELKATVRTLQKRLKKYSKGFPVEEYEEEVFHKELPKEKICYSCRIGKLMYVDLGNRYLRACSNCEYKTRSKSKDEKTKA